MEKHQLIIRKRLTGWTVYWPAPVGRWRFVAMPIAIFPQFTDAIAYVDRRIHSDVTA